MQGLLNVAWGLIKLGLGRDRQCVELLRLMEKHMDSCVAADLAVALDCFTAAKYSGEHLTPKVVAKAVERCYKQVGMISQGTCTFGLTME